jgi:hypothetical protein
METHALVLALLTPLGSWAAGGSAAVAATPPATAASATSAASPPSGPCATPEHRQLDFWIGDWDAFDIDAPGKVTARNRVDLILDGCALREVYEGTNGLVGQSFSLYDAARHVWHQSWVTNRGQLLILEGEMQGDRMVLTGTDPGKDGSHPVLLRGVWVPQEDGVRETAETSADGGKSWRPLFDIFFRRHKE